MSEIFNINPWNGTCPYSNNEARRLWFKACNYHRGSDFSHRCNNPEACLKRFKEALSISLLEGWN
tara:strand:- start:308 stop:502 length:195 start_codon:yes stop_codon:yes gene_type:complete